MGRTGATSPVCGRRRAGRPGTVWHGGRKRRDRADISVPCGIGIVSEFDRAWQACGAGAAETGRGSDWLQHHGAPGVLGWPGGLILPDVALACAPERLMSIPQIIHLTTREKAHLSPQFNENLAIMRRFYPDHEVRIHDDTDIDNFVSCYDRRYFDDVFRRLPSQIMRVDTVRYLWMEAFGGIYFDFDIRLQQPWRPETGAVLVRREWTWPRADDITVSVHNCVFASEPGHPLWRHLLDSIGRQVERYSGTSDGWPTVFDVTGPNAISRTMTQQNLVGKLDDVQILDASCIYQPGLSTHSREAALFIHQTSGSWNRSSSSRLEKLKNLRFFGRKHFRV